VLAHIKVVATGLDLPRNFDVRSVGHDQEFVVLDFFSDLNLNKSRTLAVVDDCQLVARIDVDVAEIGGKLDPGFAVRIGLHIAGIDIEGLRPF
jgi:hypothetical protein